MRYRELIAYSKYVDKQVSKIMRLENERFKIYSREKKKLEQKCYDIITKFYDSYSERNYDPYGDLYNTYRVTIDDNHWMVEYDYSFMVHSHHQDNEIIYHNVFELGYHGGSFDSEGILDQPYWRWPPGEFIMWGAPAVKSFSPKDELEKEAKICFEGMRNELIKKMIEPINTILLDWEKRIKKL